MSLSQKIELDDFSGGLMTDPESAKLPKTAASRLENADVSNGFMETLPGVTEVNMGLPAGFIKLSEEQFLFTEPSEEEVTLVYGTLSGADKLYVRPYLSSAGAWVDSWLDLTEKEGNYTADAGSGGDITDTTNIVDSELLSTTTDYYKGWILYNITKSQGAIIESYDGTAKKLTISSLQAITGQTTGDSYFLVRNPVYKVDGTYLFSPSSNGCRFFYRNNAIDIVTGSDAIYDATKTPSKTDLHLSVKNGYSALNVSDIDFTGFYLTHKAPAVMSPSFWDLSPAVIGAGEQIVPDGNYIVLPVAVYDGFQESPLYKGITPFDGTQYSNSGFGASEAVIVNLTASNKKIAIDIILNYNPKSTIYSDDVPLSIPDDDGADDQSLLILDRRITAIRIYMAEAELTGTTYKPSDIFRFVEEVSINSSDWNSSILGSNTSHIYITGEKWSAAAGIDITDRQGHASLKVHANASFIASAKKRVAVANVYADERRQSFVFFSAINSDEQNTPDVIPHTSFLDLSLYGIPKILGFIEGLGFYIALGENQLVKIDATTLSVDKNIQARGVSSSNAITNANGLIYFCNLEDIYYYHPTQDVIRSIATGFIREAWGALSTANKQAATIGYDKRFEKLVIAAGSTIYTYNLPAAYASDLASDTQAVGSWEVYSVGKTFTRFYTDLLGRCIGIASDGKSYELFSSGIANTMVYEKVLGEASLNLHTLRLTYEAAAAVTAKVFDMARNAAYPIKTYTFPTQSLHKRYDQHKGCQVRKPKLQISAPVGTKISSIVINPQPLTDEK